MWVDLAITDVARCRDHVSRSGSVGCWSQSRVHEMSNQIKSNQVYFNTTFLKNMNQGCLQYKVMLNLLNLSVVDLLNEC